MKNISRKKKNSNIFNIADNPRFKRNKESVPVPTNVPRNSHLAVFVMNKNQFGFNSGDKLICKKDFTLADINENTLVINRNTSVKPASLATSITAVVVAFQREVA